MELSERRAEALKELAELNSHGYFVDHTRILILTASRKFGELAALVLKTFGENTASLRVADALWEG